MIRTVRYDLTQFIDKRLGYLDVTEGMSKFAGMQILLDHELMGEGYYWDDEMFKETKSR